MSKDTTYEITVPLFDEETSELWSEMPNLVAGLVSKKQEARDKFNRLDTLVNGGALREIGAAFGETIYARIPTKDEDEADYLTKRLGKMMGHFLTSKTEEIVLDGKRYYVVLKEEVV